MMLAGALAPVPQSIDSDHPSRWWCCASYRRFRRSEITVYSRELARQRCALLLLMMYPDSGHMPSAHGVSRPIAFSPSDKVDRAYDPSWADRDPLYIPRIFFMSSRDISRCGVSRPPSLPEEAPRLLPYGGPWLGLSRELVGSFADAPECEAKAGLTRW